MKILVVSDLHYRLKQYDWLLRSVPGYDLLVIAGDLLDMGGFASIDAQIVVVLKYLSQLQQRVPLLVCSGNHDCDDKNQAGEFVATWLHKAQGEQVWVDGQSVPLQGDLYTACPWREGPVSRQDVAQCLEQERAQARKRWLWLYHAPPDQSPLSWTGSRHYGDAFLRDYIERYKPDFVFGGHIHNAPFAKGGSWIDRIGDTWLFNPGHQIGDFPTHITIDLDAMRARWVSFTGDDERDLAVTA
jgi:Icc-related predicted phosphoesterase